MGEAVLWVCRVMRSSPWAHHPSLSTGHRTGANLAHGGAQSFAWLHRELHGKVVQQHLRAGPAPETCASLEAQAGLLVPIPEWGAHCLRTKADGGPEHHRLMMSHPGDLCNRRRNRSVLCRLVMSLLLCSSRRWAKGDQDIPPCGEGCVSAHHGGWSPWPRWFLPTFTPGAHNRWGHWKHGGTMLLPP